jgi:hypothetical protein
MPRSALPEKIDEAHEWSGKDDDQHWYTRWRKYAKPWMAFGPRSKEWWARWREVPVVLYAKKGPGYWRFEADGKPDLWSDVEDPRKFLKYQPSYYLSRNQLWCEWHKQIQWPFFVCEHRYLDPKDVIPVGRREDRDGKIEMKYFGAKRDADRVFWFPAIYPGKNFK